MANTIKKSNAIEVSKVLSKQKIKSGGEGNLAKHFGKLKRGMDGLKYQNDLRENES